MTKKETPGWWRHHAAEMRAVNAATQNFRKTDTTTVMPIKA